MEAAAAGVHGHDHPGAPRARRNHRRRATGRRPFAHQGHVRRRHLDDQIDQALCLTLVTNACVLWTTTYLGDTIDALRADGIEVTDEIAAHLTPAQHDHINFYGTYSFDIDAELRRDGHRPLRVPA